MDAQIEQAIRELGSEEKAVQRQAALQLKEIGEPAVMPLVQALRSEAWRVRAGAAGTLGIVEDSSVIPALLELLDDKHEIVRWATRRALENRRKKDGKALFLPALEDTKEHVRLFAANLMSDLFDSPSIDALICALKEPSSYIPTVAVFAPPTVQELAEQSSYLPMLAVRSLITMGEPARDPLYQAMQESETGCLVCAEVLAAMQDARAALCLVPFLAQRDQMHGKRAERALRSLGDYDTLPRKIVAEARLSVPQRIEILQGLGTLRFYRWDVTKMSPLPDIPAYCEMMLQENELDNHAGAQQILNHYSLLRGSDRDTLRENAELLRPPEIASDPTFPSTLLRSSTEEHGPAEGQNRRPNLLQRLFHRRTEKNSTE